MIGETGTDPNIRLLKGVVIGLGILVLAAFAVVVAGVASRLGSPAPQALTGATAKSLTIPRGGRVIETHAVGGQLAIRLGLADGSERIIFFDPQTGVAAAAIELTPER
jgi:Family of unknown function (DUF6476)